MGKVLIEVTRSTTDMRRGTRAEVEVNEATTGMINGGFWHIVQPVPQAAPVKAQPAVRKGLKGQTAPEDVSSGGEDQA